jgi:gliding motility-associated-like protein/uncharacterized repeat protein (TIGR01451 family)
MNINVTQSNTLNYYQLILLAVCSLAINSQGFSQCNTGDIGGTIFQEVPAADASTPNTYGWLDANEKGMSGIIVTIVDAHGEVLMDTTDANGNWSVSPEVFPVRVEYSWQDEWLEISPGNNVNTDIQFFASPDCNARLGMYYPDEYCQMVPNVTLSCFANGDPMGGGTTGTIDAIVSFPYDRTGDATAPMHDAFMSEVGAVWGAAYNSYTQQAFYAAVMKRHVGLGAAGIGGIYRVDYSGASPTASVFLDLTALGVNLGTEPPRTLSPDWGTPASDPLMFDAPGKLGIGDIELSHDGNKMFLANLFENKVVVIDLTDYNLNGTLPTAAEVTELPAFPALACANGEARLFGLKYRRGMLYAGIVCTAESSGSPADLSASVYAIDVNTGISWSAALSAFPLNYTKGGTIDNTCTTWQPWIETYDDFTINCRPTPMLTDIEFVDDKMILSFADRYAFQKFTFQRDPMDANEESVVSGGDILIAYYDGPNYTIESNGTLPGGGGCGANGQGPGGGEYFCGESQGTEHSETSLGAMTILPGSGEVLLSVINPVNYNAGGVRRFDLATGTSGNASGYELYETVAFPGGNGNAAKGGGIGDIELMSEAAPIELLSYLWMDNNQDGIQDPYEQGIPGVPISLFDLAGNLLWIDTTDANGLYSFSDTLQPATSYYVAIGKNGAFNILTNKLNDSLDLTLPNVGMGVNADKNDSDLAIASGVHPAVNNYPYYPFTTGSSGQLVHQIDAGFFPPCTSPELVTMDTTICAGQTVNLENLTEDIEPITQFTGVYYYFASLNDALLEQAFFTGLQTPVTTTTYYVRKNTNDPTCFDIDSILVTVNPEPILITSNTTICNGDNTSLLLWMVEITGQSTTIDFYPSLADANAETNALASPVVSPTTTTQYFVRANSNAAANCFDVGNLTITVQDCDFDLAMKMIVTDPNQSPANPGDTINHSIWIYNQGAFPAYNIDWLVYLSPGVIFYNNINTNSIWAQSTNLLTTRVLGPLVSGDSLLVSLDLVVDPFFTGGTVTNFIEITGYDDDTNLNNTAPDDLDAVTDSNLFNDQVIDNAIEHPNDEDDHDVETIFINSIFDLALQVDGPATPASPCDTVTFVLTVYNNGNTDANDVVVTNYLPSNMNFDPVLPNNGNWMVSGNDLTNTFTSSIVAGDFVIHYLDLIVDCSVTETSVDNSLEITDYSNNIPNSSVGDDTDVFTLLVYQGLPPTRDTMYFTTLMNAPLVNLCMALDQLSGPVAMVNDCGQPNNGMLIITSPDVCVDYVPTIGFTGQDEACVVVCDDNALCDTTILIFDVMPLPIPTTDTVYLSTVVNITFTNACADVSELISAIASVSSCGNPSNGSMILTPGDECVDYTPSNGFVGTDVACVVVCDGSGVCDSTIFVFTVNPLPDIDTMYITLTVNTVLPNICLDISELSGAVSTAANCGNPSNGLLSISSPSNCVGYTPNNGYLGQDMACVVLCDVNAVCDTTIILFTITPDCSGVLAETDLTIQLADCSDQAEVCLEVPIMDISNYALYDNGATYTGPVAACDFDTTYLFNYATLPGMGSAGPYTVASWTVNGNSYSGMVGDMQDLTDSLNQWNPTGNWILNAASFSITGGLNSDVFGNIEMVTDTLFAQMSLIPNGSQLSFSNGSHQLVLEDLFLGCFDTLNIVATCCTELFTTPETLTALDCDTPVEFCTPIPSGDITNYTITDNGVPYAGMFGSCNLNASIALDTGYHEVIFNDFVNGCLDTAFVTVSCNPCPDFVSDGTLTLDDCADLANTCVSVAPADITNYEIRDNGVLFTGPFIGCDFDTLVTYITLGFNLNGSYELEEWEVSGVDYASITFSNANQLVDSMNVWVPSGNWMVNGLFIIGQGNINNFGPLVISANGTQVASAFATPQLQPNGTAMQVDTGLHVITVLEIATGCVDTAMVVVNCPVPQDNCNFLGADSQQINLANCNGTAALCIDIDGTNSGNYEILQNGNIYNGTTTACGVNDIPFYDYSILVGGGVFGLYNLQNWEVNGQSFSGDFNNVTELITLMNGWDPTGNWTLDAANEIIRGTDNGQTYSAMDIRHMPTNTDATLSVTYEPSFNNISIQLQPGTHEIIVNDLVNNCADTATIAVACINQEVWVEFTEVGETDTICFDLSELPGTAVGMVNFCPDASGEFAVVTLIPSLYCMSIFGAEIGQDTACIAICDDLGFCDTTYVYISIVENANLPDANQDSIYTNINTPIVSYDVTANDDMEGAPDIIYIIELPEFGGLFPDPLNGTITYVPNQDYCDPLNPDIFRYAICNDIGCDTTEVFIFVSCEPEEELSFVSGFSPNGDGINDGFRINGLANYPDHTLTIFNRWGNQVYFSDDYQNDWLGTFNTEGPELPDGTYFYLFDTGNGDLFSGYVQIHR